MISIERLLFSFSERVSFITYTQKVLNSQTKCALRNTLKFVVFKLHK